MKKIAFVDIDTQFDFMKREGSLYVKEAERIIPNLKNLTRFANKYKINIIASVDVHIAHDAEFKIFPAHCVKGKPGQRKIKETLIENRIFVNSNKRSQKNLEDLLVRFRQIILEKKTFDIFSNPNTIPLFKNIDTVFVYGVATDYCVKAVCLGLLMLHKKVRLVSDTIKAVSAKEGRKTLKTLIAKGIKLIQTKTLIK